MSGSRFKELLNGYQPDFIESLLHSVDNGIYFLERGLGLRPALGASDRGHSAVSQLRPGDIDWQVIFAGQQVRWFQPSAPRALARSVHWPTRPAHLVAGRG